MSTIQFQVAGVAPLFLKFLAKPTMSSFALGEHLVEIEGEDEFLLKFHGL